MYQIRCIGQYTDWKYELDCSHFYGRRHEATRFDPQNCDAACRKCHDWVGKTPEGMRWLRDFKLKQLGRKEYDLLDMRHNTSQKRDDILTMLYVKQLMNEI